MNNSDWLIRLDRGNSSLVLLGTLASLGILAAILNRIGLIGWVLRCFGLVVRGSIQTGFQLWEQCLSWATWKAFLAIVIGFFVIGGIGGRELPWLRVICSLVPLFMGTIACLTYMYIDLERYEVERGHMAIHNPMKGQEPAIHLARYGDRVRVPLLIVATIAMVSAFAMLNQGLYQTIGRSWYEVVGERGDPVFVDFLAYALTKLLGLVDVLNLADSRHWVRMAYIRPAAWPASTLLAGFKGFFSVVMLQQLFASLRQGKLLAETIADFWSPHESIHDRARGALAQYGAAAIGPLLVSLRAVTSLTKEQRDQLPSILATIGPSTIPALTRYLHDSHEHVRSIAVSSLGLLHASDTVPIMVELAQDSSDLVRQSVAESLGELGSTTAAPGQTTRRKGRVGEALVKRFRLRFGRKGREIIPVINPVEVSVTTLKSMLNDESVGVRTQAVRALGRIGSPAAEAAPGLIALLADPDESVRCQAAEALGRVGGAEPSTLTALTELLGDASAQVKAAAAQALGTMKGTAAPAVSALVPLLQDRDDAVRTAAAEAIAQVGPLDDAATETLVEGLSSPDTIVRAQTAEALGTIGTSAEDAAPALVEAMSDSNDRVRAKAVEALGKIGESAAETAVPSLVKALRDQDNWVSALAAEALGQMGDSADGAIPALVRSLKHVNPQVRGNSAEALGNLAESSPEVRAALEEATRDEDGGVRSQAIHALGSIGTPTPSSEQLVVAAFEDADPLVRAAAVASVGRWGLTDPSTMTGLLSLFNDPSDPVKVEVIRVLPRLAGATDEVIDGLCLRLLEDDNAWVQIQAALSLGSLGSEATAAGAALLRVVRTGEVSVREQAMRAIAKIQPPETAEALIVGLADASGEIRVVASATLMKTAVIPDEAIPGLMEALRDPEIQVRSNAAHALARLESIPGDAIPTLIECTTSTNDGLRLNSAMALRRTTSDEIKEVMQGLVADTNSRVRLIAAGFLLSNGVDDPRAGRVVLEALNDPALRVRRVAVELIESLGSRGEPFLEGLVQRIDEEENLELQTMIHGLIKSLETHEDPLLEIPQPT